MFPYWLLFSLCAAGALNARRAHVTIGGSAPLLALAGLVTAIMIGLRFEVGGDWFTYEEMFVILSYEDFWDSVSHGDIGFVTLNRLVQALGLEIWAVNLVSAAIFAWGLIKFAKRQPDPWLALVVAVPYLIIVVAMGYTRQAIAIGFIMAGLSILDRKSIVHFAGYVFCAVLFHKTAVVVLPLVALAAERNRAVTIGFVLFMSWQLYDYFLSSSMDMLVTNYVDQQYQSQGAAIRVAMNVIPALLFLMFKKRFGLPPMLEAAWRNLALAALGMLVLLLIMPSSTAVDRMALYLIPLQLFVLSRLPMAFPEKGRANVQLAVAIIAYSAAVQFVWLTFGSHADYWLPYRMYPIIESELHQEY